MEQINNFNAVPAGIFDAGAAAEAVMNQWAAGMAALYMEDKFSECIKPFNEFAHDYNSAASMDMMANHSNDTGK